MAESLRSLASVALAVALTCGGCARREGAAAVNGGADNLARVAAASGTADAAQPTPPAPTGEAEVRSFLDRLYAPYATDNAQSPPWDTVFEPRLAAAIGDEEGEPEADPLIDAQDYAPFQPRYEQVQVNNDRAMALVRFRNMEQETALVLRLLKTPAGWRVFDIDSEHGSVRERHLGTRD